MNELKKEAERIYPIQIVNEIDVNFRYRLAFIQGANYGQERTIKQTKEILGEHPFDIPKRE
jgi:hypothetical protein